MTFIHVIYDCRVSEDGFMVRALKSGNTYHIADTPARRVINQEYARLATIEEIAEYLKESGDKLQDALDEMKEAVDSFLRQRVPTNPQTASDVIKAVAEANIEASRVAVKSGESVQFYDFDERD